MSVVLNGVAHSSVPASVEAPRLQVREVTYAYPGSNRLALNRLTLTLGAGTTAIVGPNGAGKSTLVKLLTGLLRPTSGDISIHLPDVGGVSPAEIRKSVLFQEPAHLYLTIRQNITMRFERAAGEDERIRQALHAAGLSKVIDGLPDGLETLVGSGFGGQTDLSGGQWQRLALARLIFHDAPLLLLDEPVASLDPDGERAVFELFAQRAKDKIIVFTTHRYDSIPRNTRIIVLVDGQISEAGTHDELLERRREYWSLYTASQFTSRPDEWRRMASGVPPVEDRRRHRCALCGATYVR
jgi:ABC-type multidrug transport system fused ATPase/permease subunit